MSSVWLNIWLEFFYLASFLLYSQTLFVRDMSDMFKTASELFFLFAETINTFEPNFLEGCVIFHTVFAAFSYFWRSFF